MEFNFCDKRLKTSVTSNKVSADGFEVQNLLSNSLSGFRVEYFVKPPVDIIFKFEFPIDIRKIICDLKVGERRTTTGQFFLAGNSGDFKYCGYFETTKDAVCFINTGFKVNKKYSNFIEKKDYKNCDLLYVPRKHQQFFVKVNHLKIRLLKAENSGICVLKYIKVYGQPNNSVINDDNVIKLLNSVFSESTPVLETTKETSKRKHTEDEEKTNSFKKRVEIPSEFLDPITNEVMLLPTILPSGNTIDKSTLDKYVENEAIWGRPANDPFTNRSFDKNSEPVPNTALKIRIDSFLTNNHNMLNKEELPNLRIVGGYYGSNKVVDPDPLSVIDRKCVLCFCKHSGNQIQYKLPCGHLICRKLHCENFKIYQTQCQICSQEYSSQSIIRYFGN